MENISLTIELKTLRAPSSEDLQVSLMDETKTSQRSLAAGCRTLSPSCLKTFVHLQHFSLNTAGLSSECLVVRAHCVISSLYRVSMYWNSERTQEHGFTQQI
ncbi:uncharacterized protein ACO6RY_03557 [Pungitius sinensis]